MIILIRGLLTFLLCYMVYTEAGIFTALAIFLTSLASEAASFLLGILSEKLRDTMEIVKHMQVQGRKEG